MSANDTANAQRFEAIQKQLDAMCSDHARDHGDHEERIRSLEKKGVMGSIADGLIAIGAVIAGVLGSRA
jgi:6,7-dimethyl-8-ribityllumazine synthase